MDEFAVAVPEQEQFDYKNFPREATFLPTTVLQEINSDLQEHRLQHGFVPNTAVGIPIWAAGMLGIRLQPAICFTESMTGFLRNSSELTAINPRARLAQHSHRMISVEKNFQMIYIVSLQASFPVLPLRKKTKTQQQPENKQTKSPRK